MNHLAPLFSDEYNRHYGFINLTAKIRFFVTDKDTKPNVIIDLSLEFWPLLIGISFFDNLNNNNKVSF